MGNFVDHPLRKFLVINLPKTDKPAHRNLVSLEQSTVTAGTL